MDRKIRWGILGTGNIAAKFAKGLQALDDAEITAVGSRADNTAEKFGRKFSIPNRHDSYQKLANDPDVDVVYVATPHPPHMENTILCLNAGKAVLCEKPFAVNAAQARQMIDVAKSQKLFLMEAMWTRFWPAIVKLRSLLEQNVIGRVNLLWADYCATGDWGGPQSRMLNPQLAGGALLDIGVYPVSFASMVFGQKPSRIAAGLACFAKTGVDEQSAFVLGYRENQLAMLACAITTKTNRQASLYGTKGSIRLGSDFYKATELTLSVEGKKERIVKFSPEKSHLSYQADEVMRCIRAGKLQSRIMPLDETLSIMETMDEIRAQWGLKYPME